MLKRIVLPILIVVVAVIIYLAMMQSKVEKPTIEKPEKVWQVTVIPAKIETISPEITLYGRVETPRKATLKSAIIADVIDVSVLEGTVVDIGQIVVTLDDTDLKITRSQRQADLAEIEALIRSEKLRFKRDQSLLENEKKLLKLTQNAVSRAKKLQQSNLASQANLDESLAEQQRQILAIERLQYDISEHPVRLAGLQARLARATAFLKQADVDLQRTVIKAPFKGRIAKLSIAKGDRVRVGDPLLTIYDVANLEVRAQIPGRYIASVRQQLAKGIQAPATAQFEGKLLSFNLNRLSGEIRQDSGGVDGLFRLTDAMTSLALGTFVELRLQLEKQDKVIAIPFDALYELDRVYRLNQGYLEGVKIKRIGEYQPKSGEKQLLIQSDKLTESDQIISTQLPNAITGLRVEIVQDVANE